MPTDPPRRAGLPARRARRERVVRGGAPLRRAGVPVSSPLESGRSNAAAVEVSMRTPGFRPLHGRPPLVIAGAAIVGLLASLGCAAPANAVRSDPRSVGLRGRAVT